MEGEEARTNTQSLAKVGSPTNLKRKSWLKIHLHSSPIISLMLYALNLTHKAELRPERQLKTMNELRTRYGNERYWQKLYLKVARWIVWISVPGIIFFGLVTSIVSYQVKMVEAHVKLQDLIWNDTHHHGK